jgi:hypothetical protein
MRRRLIWGLPAAVYLLFAVWYTDFGGPLSAAEIERFSALLEAQGFAPERVARVRDFMESDTGRSFLMLNAIDLAEQPPRVEGAPPDATAEDLMALYMEHMTPELLKRACHPVVIGTAVHGAMDLVGIEGAEHWSLGALVRYRSRRALMEIVAMPETHARHAFKVAALDKTIAYPIETRILLGDARLLLGLLLFSVASGADLAFGLRSPR